MGPRRLARGLTRRQAHPPPGGPVRVAHPLMSMVFLAGDYAYKIRKPRALGFLDFTALAARVCLGVVSVVEEAGALRIVLDPDAPGAVE